MSEHEKKLDGPDFAQGVPLEDLGEGSIILGQAAGEAVVLARTDGALFAIGAECTHYHGPLAEGMLVADTVRCPLAPCLLQPAHRRGIARPGAGPGRVLACRPTGRKNLCPRQA